MFGLNIYFGTIEMMVVFLDTEQDLPASQKQDSKCHSNF